MKILVCGGGTGGHITPNLAVAHELKTLQPNCIVNYVAEKNSQFSHLLKNQSDLDHVYHIHAGKFRRYYKQSLWTSLSDLTTIKHNIRDVFRTIQGFYESWKLLRKDKPDAIFIKGSFVGVPIGLIAAFMKIPYMTHDSDTMPGLANRIIAKWARYHATGMPIEFYSYPKEKARFVGIILDKNYQLVTPALMKKYRHFLAIPQESKVLLITGGSLGAQRLNKGIAAIVPDLLRKYPELYIIHQVGKNNSSIYVSDITDHRLIVKEFIDQMYMYSGAADLIITRGGANTLGELSAQAKASIVVPNPLLTGGHQIKNADHLRQQNAIEVITEKELLSKELTMQSVSQLLDSAGDRNQLAQRLGSLARPNAAQDVAKLLIELAK
ncbi:MAG: undecaprenyldiphospho-muramoylpentapeptide beta-N-acetylglucosaminyltransferase [Candidatus Saccharimonadales bacterium]